MIVQSYEFYTKNRNFFSQKSVKNTMLVAYEKAATKQVAASVYFLRLDYAILLIWRQRLDLRFAALLRCMMFVLANLSSIF